jgi:hypothetical protein
MRPRPRSGRSRPTPTGSRWAGFAAAANQNDSALLDATLDAAQEPSLGASFGARRVEAQRRLGRGRIDRDRPVGVVDLCAPTFAAPTLRSEEFSGEAASDPPDAATGEQERGA